MLDRLSRATVARRAKVHRRHRDVAGNGSQDGVGNQQEGVCPVCRGRPQKKGGKTIHSITRLAEAPPVGEVTVDGVLRSDDQAMLHEEHDKWSKIWGMHEEVDPDPWNLQTEELWVPKPAD